MKRLDSLGLKYLIEKILRKVGELKCECEGGSSTSIDSITEPLIVALFYDGVIVYTTTTGEALTGLPKTIGEAVIKYNAYIRNIGVIGLDKPVISFAGFNDLVNLEHLVLPNTVTTIGPLAVERTGIKSIVIPDSVQSIGKYAFNECSELASVTIGNSVETIDESAFSCCSALTTITIPESVTSIASNALSGCTFYKSKFINLSALDEVANNYWGATIIEDEEEEPIEPLVNNIIYYTSSDESIVAPVEEAFNGLKIVNNTYKNGLGAIVFDGEIVNIGENAFHSCFGLTSITIPDSVTSIEQGSFCDCSSLTSVTIGNSVTSIGNYAFALCYGLTSITIPNGVTSIGEFAFQNCESLTSITIPSSVTNIGDGAFQSCAVKEEDFINLSSLDAEANNYWGATIIQPEEPELEWAPCGEKTSYAYNDGTLYVSGDGAMYDYSATTDRPWDGQTITSVVIEEGVTYIGKNAFTGTSITEITIPLGVTILGHSAFKSCALLETVNLPSSISQIQSSTFQYCNAISTINYEGTLEQWLTIDFDSVTSNPANTTGSCLYVDGDHIVDAVIPETITTIRSYSLSGSHMKSIDLHAGVKTIQTLAFGNCKQLQTITSRAVEPPKMSSKNYIDSVTAVYVPAESIDAYNLQTNWASYTAVIQALE